MSVVFRYVLLFFLIMTICSIASTSSFHGAFYVPLDQVLPGQLRYAHLHVRDKMAKALASGKVIAGAQGRGYILAHNRGTSVFSLDAALPVLKTPVGYVLVDGHHEFLMARTFGATTIPVYIKAHIHYHTAEQFWHDAESAGLVYPYALNGKRQITASWDTLENDPLRYFVAQTARKYVGGRVVQDPTCALWIKRDKGVPFIEFKIADVLRLHGHEYSFLYSEGASISEDMVQRARQVLKRYPVIGVDVVL